MEFSYLNMYIAVIVLLKILLVLSILRLSYYRFFNPEDIEEINDIEGTKYDIECLFLFLTFLLMIFLFRLNNNNPVRIDGHVKTLLFVTGIVGAFSILQKEFVI